MYSVLKNKKKNDFYFHMKDTKVLNYQEVFTERHSSRKINDNEFIALHLGLLTSSLSI